MDFVQLAHACAPWVADTTLAAIVRTESQFRPLAIGVNGGAHLAHQPASKAEAVVTARWLLAHGYNIDLGLGQVNSRNLAATRLSVEDAFEPCLNLAAAGAILSGHYAAARRSLAGAEQAVLHAAISAYNTGSFTKGFTNGYVYRVMANAPRLPDGGVVEPIPLEPFPPRRRLRLPPVGPIRPMSGGDTRRSPPAPAERPATAPAPSPWRAAATPAHGSPPMTQAPASTDVYGTVPASRSAHDRVLVY